VPAQFDQLSTLICRGGEAARSRSASYTLPAYSPGDTSIGARAIAMRWCPPELRKRPIDVVLLSIGGNDVGFASVALYAITESASDLAPIAQLLGKQIRFGPDVARNYLRVFDRRLAAVKEALHDGFGVAPGQVVQTSYEPIQFDETGAMCGAIPTLGLDVHPKLRMSRERITEAAAFTTELDNRLECLTDVHRRHDCPAGLATGQGTGFHLVTDHLAKFMKRGVCARDPKRAVADGLIMGMPRLSQASGAFVPYSPANALPYAHRWRLFHTANDAFLTANTHREGISPFDILQPSYAGLYSGAIHPTAEGHAMVADSVVLQVRAVLDKRPAHAAGVSN
jgi:lysophospholipase L1-like esterase